MNRRNYSDIEDEIRKSINKAIDSIDIAGIKNEFKGRAESAFDDAKDSLKKGAEALNKKIENASKDRYKNYRKSLKRENNNLTNKAPQYITKQPKGRYKGMFYFAGGMTLNVVFGLATLGSVIAASVLRGLGFASNMGTVICGSLLCGSIVMTMRGVFLRKRVRSFRNYVKYLNGRTYCSIKELADDMGKKEKYIVKDLEYMIENKMFLQGHIDDKKSYFMLNDGVYNDYIEAEKSLKQRTEDEERRKKIEQEEDAKNPQNKEIRRIISEGRQYIEEIKKANQEILEEEISDKLYRLEKVVTEIFNYIEKNPGKINYVNKFINHYLPITLKLINSYKELNNQYVQGENIIKARNEIKETLDVINSAFEKLLDDLFEEVALDISTDISVLHTLFNAEGLTEEDFKKKS